MRLQSLTNRQTASAPTAQAQGSRARPCPSRRLLTPSPIHQAHGISRPRRPHLAAAASLPPPRPSYRRRPPAPSRPSPCRRRPAPPRQKQKSPRKLAPGLPGSPGHTPSRIRCARIVRSVTSLFIGGSCKTVQRVSDGEIFGTQIVIGGVADAFVVSGSRDRRLPATRPARDRRHARPGGPPRPQQAPFKPDALRAHRPRRVRGVPP